jgi:hypothetical protein
MPGTPTRHGSGNHARSCCGASARGGGYIRQGYLCGRCRVEGASRRSISRRCLCRRCFPENVFAGDAWGGDAWGGDASGRVFAGDTSAETPPRIYPPERYCWGALPGMYRRGVSLFPCFPFSLSEGEAERGRTDIFPSQRLPNSCLLPEKEEPAALPSTADRLNRSARLKHIACRSAHPMNGLGTAAIQFIAPLPESCWGLLRYEYHGGSINFPSPPSHVGRIPAGVAPDSTPTKGSCMPGKHPNRWE